MADRRVALITGAGRGIGRAIALRLAEDGLDVAVNDIDMASARRVAGEIKALGRRSMALPADVSNRQEVFDIVGQTVADFDRLDVMVNNAGVVQMQRLTDVKTADLERIFAINAFGVFYGIQAAAQQMIKQGYGKIINAASVGGHQGFAYQAPYVATKFAVVGLTQSAAKELAPQGITVNAYCPGVVATDMMQLIADELSVMLGVSKQEAVESFSKLVALGRLEKPEDVAGLVSYLASVNSDYMTGQSINIDGGMHFV
jgi:meso-butanediol dehydrogenase/(S,S)-butanediol dehydrogenase/diacetyl reductase